MVLQLMVWGGAHGAVAGYKGGLLCFATTCNFRLLPFLLVIMTNNLFTSVVFHKYCNPYMSSICQLQAVSRVPRLIEHQCTFIERGGSTCGLTSNTQKRICK